MCTVILSFESGNTSLEAVRAQSYMLTSPHTVRGLWMGAQHIIPLVQIANINYIDRRMRSRNVNCVCTCAIRTHDIDVYYC